MATPKNYITSGINKNLLTPCRRIGLSRTKKTPKNDKPSPLTSTPKLEVASTPLKCVKVDVEIQKENTDFNETPKKLPTPKKPKKNFVNTVIKEETNKPGNKHIAVEVHHAKTKSDKTAQNTNETASPIDKNTLTKSPDQNCAKQTLVVVEVHHPVAKRNIDFNQIDIPSEIQDQKQNISKNDVIPMLKDHTSTSSHTLANSKSRVKKRKLVLEDDDFLTSENLEDSSVDRKNTSKTTNIQKTLTTTNQSHEKISTKNVKLQSQKEKVVKDTLVVDEIGCNKNKGKTGHINSSVSKCIKDDTTVLKENNSGITLGRFTTEDYLREYSSNPEMFQESLEKEDYSREYSSNPEIIQESLEKDSSDDDFMPFKSFSKKLKQKQNDKSHVESPSAKKNYVAIVCPLNPVNPSDKKLKNCLSTQKLSEKKNSKITLQDCESNLKPKLSITLERLNPDNLRKKINSKDTGNSSKVLPCTPELVKSKSKSSKINFCDDDDDDELFTSSPQNQKQQQENLLKLISDIENKIKQKEEKLEKLKQAQVYKKKHSPEKLKVSSDRWFEGCRSSLTDLLIKMQEHGPMEMDVLIRNLRIPANIIERLKL